MDSARSLFHELADGRTGHFLLESGHHGGLWLDLDSLFAAPARVEPLVVALADTLRPHRADAVCGPLLGGAFLAQRVAELLDAEFWYTEREPIAESGGLYRARYRLPAALARRARGRRVAMVDDVMSAGSALRGTSASLRACGASPVVAAALLVLGDAGASYFAAQSIPVESVIRESYALWPPKGCPLCAAGAPLEAAPGS